MVITILDSYLLFRIHFFLQCFTSNCFISPSQLTVFLVTMECQMVPVSLALLVHTSQTKGSTECIKCPYRRSQTEPGAVLESQCNDICKSIN